MSIRRRERVTELIQQEISKKIPLLKDPGLGFITVLAVRLSADFNQAKVFYSVLGTDDERRKTQEALERAKGVIRGHLRSLENLKDAPDLMFVLDNSAGRSAKSSQCLESRSKKSVSRIRLTRSLDRFPL